MILINKKSLFVKKKRNNLCDKMKKMVENCKKTLILICKINTLVYKYALFSITIECLKHFSNFKVKYHF